MLFTTSQDSIKRAFEYIVKLPFTKKILHKISEKARGNCIVYFSLHRVIDDTKNDHNHPHFMNKTALTPKQAHRLLAHINHRLPFVSLSDSLELLKGNQKMDQSHAVLLIEVPYLQTMRLLLPILEELRIPATIILNTESIYDGQMPWMDEIIFRLGSTAKDNIAVNFIDRSFSLTSASERMSAAHHFIEHLSHANPDSLLSKLNQLRQILWEVAIHPVTERICTLEQLEKVALNPLFSFACAGRLRLPFFDISLNEAEKEIVEAKQQLLSMFNRAFIPVFFYPLGSDKRRHKEIVKLMMDNGYLAAIGRSFGVCRPGDNMFRLARLPLALGLKSFEQFELQGLSDAIDELLLVTFAKEKEL